MVSEAILFAGITITSGRKPITFAALDDKLEIVILAQWDISEVITGLNEYETVQLAINIPRSKAGMEIFNALQENILQAGFKHYSLKNSQRLWIASNAEECYRVFQPDLLARRTLEGRIQRGLILYEEGLQIADPMDFFEEITRYKLMQGSLPAEGLHSPSQLDALVMAYVSWLAGNPSERVMIRGDLFLPAPG